LGGTFSVNEDTHLALSYRGKIKHKIDDGSANFIVPAAAAPLQGMDLFVNTSGNATVTLPAVATLSATHRLNEQWSLMADISHTYWETAFDQVTVKFNSNQPDAILDFKYRDTTFISLGSEYQLSQVLILRAGLAYDPTPTTTKYRDVRVPDNNRKWLSFGLGWLPSENMEINVGYTHLFVSNPSFNATTSTGDKLAGSYKVNGDILAASINYRF